MKSMLNKFHEYINSIGISTEDVYEEQGEGFSLISFAEEGEANSLYNISLIFYKDDSVEVYIRKSITNYKLNEVLLKLNELNAEYRGVTFLVDEDMLTVKSYCITGGDIKVVLREMVQDMQLAQAEFKKII